jgi:hypothetical protein
MIVGTLEGAYLFWDYILKITTPNNPYVHLLGSAYTPLHTSTLANFAANQLPLVSGYAPIQLVNPGANWTITYIAAGAQATYTTLSWTFTAALTVYGYYLSDDGAGISWWGEAFIPAYIFPAAGGLFTLSLPPYLVSCPGVSAC